jgi:hypothetical protein
MVQIAIVRERLAHLRADEPHDEHDLAIRHDHHHLTTSALKAAQQHGKSFVVSSQRKLPAATPSLRAHKGWWGGA